ncbi:MAG: M13 family metallopeptidase [Acidobacteriaceae bacterium]|nr:M13 family metallopeptidase [Acidobacteriaceae bacterium]
MRNWKVAGFCVSLILLGNGQFVKAQQSSPEEAPKLEHFDPNMVDKSLDPCQDFYQFVCSKWNVAHPIPADQVSWGTGSGLRYWNENILREVMEKASSQTTGRTDLDQKLGDYWGACMNESAVEEAGIRELKPELERINAMKAKSELAGQVAHIHMSIPGAWDGEDNQTDAALMGFGPQQDFDDASRVVAGIDQGGLGMPNRDFYLKDDPTSKQIREKYEAHITKMLTLVGESAAQSATDAKTVLAIESAMAKAQMDNISRRDPKNVNNKMSFEQVQALTPSYDWKQYVAEIGAPPSQPHYLVTSPSFFKELEQVIQQHSVDDWKVYLRWQLVHGSAPYLNKALADENWDFYSHTLLGSKAQLPRWRRCVRAADRDLGMGLGEAYVKVAFPPSSKERTVALVHDIEHALDQDIMGLNWMQPATKEQAEVKLHGIEDIIGYPNHWRDYSSVKITRESYLNNVHEAARFEFHRQLNKINKPVDRSEWQMTPSTINAYYQPQLNSINFPAGILQPPYFDPSKEDAVNYGAVGVIIGHEITHGFDDQGRKFDAKGDLRNWLTPEDAKAYEQRDQCIIDEYTQEIPEAGVKQNGQLTAGEDTADNGGAHLALMALSNEKQREGKSLDAKDPDGWTPRQKFFLSYANEWCTQYRPELMRTIVLTNPHSIPKYRVNNVVSNMPEFEQAFSCKAGAPMVRKNQCRVW